MIYFLYLILLGTSKQGRRFRNPAWMEMQEWQLQTKTG
jgi:hypothetical protein